MAGCGRPGVGAITSNTAFDRGVPRRPLTPNGRWLVSWHETVRMPEGSREVIDIAQELLTARRESHRWPFGVGNRVHRNDSQIHVSRGLVFNHPYAASLDVQAEPIDGEGACVSIKASLAPTNPLVEVAAGVGLGFPGAAGLALAMWGAVIHQHFTSLTNVGILAALLLLPCGVLLIARAGRRWVARQASDFMAELDLAVATGMARTLVSK